MIPMCHNVLYCGEPCHVSYSNIQILLFNSLSKRFEYLKCKASELISKQYRISY